MPVPDETKNNIHSVIPSIDRSKYVNSIQCHMSPASHKRSIVYRASSDSIL